MKILCSALLLTASMAFVLLGCSDNAAPIVAPNDEAVSAPTSPTALSKGAWIQIATGSGHTHPRGAGLCTISFTAQKDADGLCKGEWQAYDRDIDIKIHLKVVHLDVEGNQAFLVAYGMLPETPWYGPPTPGYGMILITDNGQGNNADLPDQHSWFSVWPDNGQMPWAFVTSSLATASVSEAKSFLTGVPGFGWPEAMLYVPAELGNLQVRSR